jgi:membrane associated rhomboid family serine protease
MRGDGFGGGGAQLLIGPQRTPEAIKKILVALVAVFFAQVLLELVRPLSGVLSAAGIDGITHLGALSGETFFERGWVWQPLTAIFLHDYSRLGHLLGNLFFLWMFGSPVAEELGTRRFLRLFVVGGVVAGVLKLAVIWLFHAFGWDWSQVAWETRSIGASGAVFVVVCWYCYRWPDRPISLLLLPITFTGRQAIPLWFLMEFGTAGGGVDHFIHVAGAAVGYFALRRHLSGPGGSGGSTRRPPRKRRGPGPRALKDDGPLFH